MCVCVCILCTPPPRSAKGQHASKGGAARAGGSGSSESLRCLYVSCPYCLPRHIVLLLLDSYIHLFSTIISSSTLSNINSEEVPERTGARLERLGSSTSRRIDHANPFLVHPRSGTVPCYAIFSGWRSSCGNEP